MKRIYKLGLACALFMTGQAAFAVDYFWGYQGGQYPSADAACNAHLQRMQSQSSGYVSYEVKLNAQGTAGQCVLYNSIGNSLGSMNIGRSGDSCPEGGIYNTTLGRCDIPDGDECGPVDNTGFPQIKDGGGVCVPALRADKPSFCRYLGTRGSTRTELYIKYSGDVPQPPDVSGIGCKANPVSVAHCKLPAPKPPVCTNGVCIELPPTGGKCQVFVTFTGEPALEGGDGYTPPVADVDNEESGFCDDPNGCAPADEPVLKESKPCNYMHDGQVVGCESSAFEGKPGEVNCGTFQGKFQCITKPASSNGVNIKTDIKTTDNGNGTTTETKTDTVTQVKCETPGSCVTNVTNNKSVTIKGPNGETLGQSGECVGPACSTGGKGDADGDGLGDCITGNCEEQEGTEVGAQGWHEGLELTAGGVLGDFASRVQAAGVVQGAQQFFTVNASGACPVWSASVWVFDVTLDQHCTTEVPWDLIRAVLLACAGFVAFRWAFL